MSDSAQLFTVDQLISSYIQYIAMYSGCIHNCIIIVALILVQLSGPAIIFPLEYNVMMWGKLPTVESSTVVVTDSLVIARLPIAVAHRSRPLVHLCMVSCILRYGWAIHS